MKNIIKTIPYVFSAFLVVYMAGSLFLIAEQKRAIEDLRMQLNYDHNNITNIIRNLQKEDHNLARELDEFQRWRLHLTTVARMGWQLADRFMLDYPIKYSYYVEAKQNDNKTK